MKFHEHLPDSTYAIRGYSDDGITVNDRILTSSFIITPDHLIESWKPHRYSDLSSNDLAQLIQFKPEIILLGTGKRLHIPQSELLSSILLKGIGFEAMDTFAACRCYSILASEERKVVAGMIVEMPDR